MANFFGFTIGQNKSLATVILGSLSQTYDGMAKSATATTTPPGLTVNFTYNGSANAPTNAGSYTVIGTVNDLNYRGSATSTLIIGQASATVTLGSLSQIYNGSARSATATTTPPRLTVDFTYDGSGNAPTNVGSYTVIGTVNDPNAFSTSATNTLVIGKGTASVTLGNLSQTYDGTARSVSVTTAPPGLTVNVTYNGSANAPTNAGSYTVIGTVNDPNAFSTSATNTLVIGKATAIVTLGNLAQTYDGTAKSVSVTTAPPGLTVNVTYNGSANAPTNAGSYTVIGTVNDPNAFSTSATNTLVIGPAPGTVLDHFVWSPVNSPQTSGVPFAVTIAAKDALNNTVTNFTGTVALSSSNAISTSSNILGSPVHNSSSSGNFTLGYAFTPGVDILVTRVRHYFGNKVSIWTDSGTLLASQNVTSTPGTWVETPLSPPVLLTAGTRYRVGTYTGGGNYYWHSSLPANFAFGTINQSYNGFGDVFPTAADSVRWWFVDLRYSVGASGSIAITPTNSSPFFSGSWTGNVTVQQPGTNIFLRADDGAGHSGTSGVFLVLAPPTIVTQPTNQTVIAGANMTFNVITTGTAPLFYQWRKGDTNLSDGGKIFGSTTPTLILTDVLGTESGGYSVVISNLYGSVTSSVATLTVIDPVISSQPFDQYVNWGDSAFFSVTAAGTPPLSYQWRKEGIKLPGATNSFLLVTNAQLPNAGHYDVVVSNALGSVTSVVATLIVLDPAIVYLEPPEPRNINAGQSARFRVFAVGTPPLAYQWRRNGANVAGATTSALVLANAEGSDAGYYDVIVTNISGSVTSEVALLTVNLVTLDSVFSVDGNVYAPLEQSDGKILVGGQFFELNHQPRDNIGRLNAGGGLDPNFFASASPGNQINCLVVQTDGKILVGGQFYELDFEYRENIGRLNPDGSLDYNFVAAAGSEVNCLAVQPDGKILVGGQFFELNGLNHPGIGRLNSNGSLDNSFNPIIENTVYCLAIQSDGKIIVGGEFFEINGQEHRNIGRLNANGSVDSAFNPHVEGSVRCIAIQTDGKILIGGEFFEVNGQERSGIARLNSDGSLDTNFNASASGEFKSLVLQADGKILAVGGYFSIGGVEFNGIVRLNVNGAVDLNFNPSGFDFVYSLSLQKDGRILTGEESRIRRFNNTVLATEALTFNGSIVTWLRGGASPEVWRTTYEYSTNGSNWIALGSGSRIAGGWQRTNVSVPPNTTIRARGFTANGRNNGSGSFVETTINPPAIIVQPISQSVFLGDEVEFSVVATGMDPSAYQWRRDGVPISGATNSALTLSNLQASDAAVYSVMVINALGAATSSNAVLVVIAPLEVALDTPSLSWVSGGYALWFGQFHTMHDGVDAAQSGAITHNQYCWVETTVTGPGTLSFWWKVSSELDYDFLELRTNGMLAAYISGEVPWQQRILPLGQGLQVLRWRYAKDTTVTAGKDMAWLDQVLFISSQPTILVGDGSFGFTSNRFGFNISGLLGQIVVVEGSTNLLTWTSLATNTLGSGPFYFTDPNSANLPRRFYRVKIGL